LGQHYNVILPEAMVAYCISRANPLRLSQIAPKSLL
jgi:hypothetical protein